MPDLQWEEYKLLQDKVDKLGGFRFQVKGWLITLVTGFLLAGKVTGVPWWAYTPAILLIFSFSLLEKHHRQWEKALLWRIVELEELMLDREKEADRPFGIAKVRRPTTLDWQRPRSPADAIEKWSLRVRRNWFGRWFVVRADWWFYFFQYAMVVVACFLGWLMRAPQAAPAQSGNAAQVAFPEHSYTDRGVAAPLIGSGTEAQGRAPFPNALAPSTAQTKPSEANKQPASNSSVRLGLNSATGTEQSIDRQGPTNGHGKTNR